LIEPDFVPEEGGGLALDDGLDGDALDGALLLAEDAPDDAAGGDGGEGEGATDARVVAVIEGVEVAELGARAGAFASVAIGRL
jgi:hypothetical protein